jgi:myo-inositol catabolism protein IolC
MVNLLRIRNNAKITEIEIEPEKLQVVQKTLQSNVSSHMKENIVKKFAVGRCCICTDVATQMVTYEVGDQSQGATRIERYCDSCVKKVYECEAVLL